MSEIKIHKFFPVPVFEQKLDDYKILNNELEKFIYDLKKRNPDGQKKSNAGGWHSPFFNIQETDVLKNLFEVSKIACIKSCQIIWDGISIKKKLKF